MNDLNRLRQWLCRHEFAYEDLEPRDKAGMVQWPCQKCGRVFREPYGLAMGGHGTLIGWRNRRGVSG